LPDTITTIFEEKLMGMNGSLMLAVVVAALLPRPVMAQDAAKGEQVYAAQKCQMCHMAAGKGNKNSPLDGVASRLSAAEIKAWIVDPVAAAATHASTKKPLMPKTYAKLPATDIDALVAYVQSLK
jgi:mono/diheme cytochrome c family protein